MPTYEVRVEGTAVQIYEVEADSEEEARLDWEDGWMVSEEVHSPEVVYVELMADDFDDDDYPEDDEYEPDPLHEVDYDRP